MKRYDISGYDCPTAEIECENGEWCKADGVAELAKRVLPYIKVYEEQNRVMYTNYGLAEIMRLIAELEQIAGK